MSLVPAQKQPPEVKEEKTTATEKEGPREKAGHWQERVCLPSEGGGKGKAQKGQEAGEGPRMGPE